MHPLYDAARRTFFAAPPLLFPVQFFIDAPFGRFAPTDSIFLVDAIRAWMVMEAVAPIAFVYALVNKPLASSPADVHPLTPAQHILIALFLVHYANRAVLSPLRTPSRSKMHIGIAISSVVFNVVNGTLLGTYLHSSTAAAFLAGVTTRPVFWAGTLLWAAGFVGNVLHDEILLNIRRVAKAKGKAKSQAEGKEHYGIPQGYLYAYVSYPNYLCEWVEWFGFALAAAPVPCVASLGALMSSVHPPWIFFSSEVSLMIARAYKGHRWYLDNLPDYPKDRKAVIPYVY